MRHVPGVAEMVDMACVRAVAAVYWAVVKPRRLRERRAEPKSPDGEKGAEPYGTTHDPIIQPETPQFTSYAPSPGRGRALRIQPDRATRR